MFKRESYLVSTDVEDGRRWRFDVSMVSRFFRETLIHSYSVVPAVQKKAIDDYGAWSGWILWTMMWRGLGVIFVASLVVTEDAQTFQISILHSLEELMQGNVLENVQGWDDLVY